MNYKFYIASKKKIRFLCEKLASLLRMAGRIISPKKQEMRVKSWFDKNGDKTLRLNYKLTNNSIVFDVGAYQGDWASDIFSKYCCNIFCFEPVSQFAKKLQKRFECNKKIEIFNFGLSDTNKDVLISLAKDSSSMFHGDLSETVKLIKIDDFLVENGIRHIDLMKINIEGSEYDFLDYLINSMLIKKINNIQIQFHDFVPNAKKRMKQIQQNLSITHNVTYQYEFVWENWQRKKL